MPIRIHCTEIGFTRVELKTLKNVSFLSISHFDLGIQSCYACFERFGNANKASMKAEDTQIFFWYLPITANRYELAFLYDGADAMRAESTIVRK